MRFATCLIGFGFLVPRLAAAQSKKPFLASWAGQWRGSLTIYGPKGTAQTVPMQLDIIPIDSSRSTFYVNAPVWFRGYS